MSHVAEATWLKIDAPADDTSCLAGSYGQWFAPSFSRTGSWAGLIGPTFTPRRTTGPAAIPPLPEQPISDEVKIIMGMSLLDDEAVVVRTPEEFLAMPEEYREILLRQVMVNTEGELSGGDDYVQVFLPLAPNAEERQVCAERAVEEYDHYKLGKAVLAKVGVDTSYMEKQTLAERNLFADQTLHTCTTWAERGIFSYIGEEIAMIMIKEFSQSSYKPWAEAVRTIILDEKVHIAHGARVCRNLAQTDEGREELQQALDRLWPTFVKIFGSPRSERARLAVKFGLRQTTNGECLDTWRKKMTPRIQRLGLRVPE